MDRNRDGAHPQRIREANERGIVAAIRSGGVMTKSQLADELGLTRQAINIIVGDMLAEGVLREGGRKTGGVGRSSTYYALDASAAFAIGVVAEAGGVEAMLVDFLGAAHYRATVAGDAGEGALAGAAASIRSHCQAAGIGADRIVGVGAVLAGPELPAALPDPAAMALQRRLEAAFGLPSWVDRRAAAAATAEHLRAEGAPSASFLYLCCDAGVSAAMMLNGRLHRGERGLAMQIGALPAATRPASSENEVPRLLNDIVPPSDLRRRLAAARVSGGDLHAANLARPDVVENWIAEAGAALGSTLAPIQAALDLGAVVIDIDLPAGIGHRLAERIAATLTRALPPHAAVPQVMRSRLGRDAALLGAAMLPLDARFGAGAGTAGRRAQVRTDAVAASL